MLKMIPSHGWLVGLFSIGLTRWEYDGICQTGTKKVSHQYLCSHESGAILEILSGNFSDIQFAMQNKA
jgi:hypothetical protein